MALTQITEKGIKDGEIVNADINASAAISKSKIENLINNNANDRVITGSGTANTLNGESGVQINSNGRMMVNGTYGAGMFNVTGETALGLDAKRQFLGIDSHNDDMNIRATYYSGGASGAAYPDIKFTTSDSERLRITADGKVGIGSSSPAYNVEIEGAGGGDGVSLAIQNTGSSPAGVNLLSGHGHWSVYNSKTVGDALEFRDESANSTRMMLDTHGRLNLGTTTAGHGDLDDLTIATSGNTGITIRSGTTSNGTIGFADGTSGNAQYMGVIDYDHNTNRMAFNANDSTALCIDNNGNIGIGSGTAEVQSNNHYSTLQLQGTSGTGGGIVRMKTADGSTATGLVFVDGGGMYIRQETNHPIFFETNGATRARFDGDGLKFGTDTNADNALNDYEEGTWTPQLIRNGQNSYVSIGSGNRYGYYKKVGKILFLSFYWYNPSLSDSAGQYWIIQNMPYTLKQGNAGAYQFLPGGYYYMNGSNVGDHPSNGSYRWQSNSNGLVLYSASNNMNANGAVEFSGCGAVCVA